MGLPLAPLFSLAEERLAAEANQDKSLLSPADGVHRHIVLSATSSVDPVCNQRYNQVFVLIDTLVELVLLCPPPAARPPLPVLT